MKPDELIQGTILSENRELPTIAALAYEFGLYVEHKADRVVVVGSKRTVDHLFNALQIVGMAAVGMIRPLWGKQ
jgi:hypothetical protein